MYYEDFFPLFFFYESSFLYTPSTKWLGAAAGLRALPLTWIKSSAQAVKWVGNGYHQDIKSVMERWSGPGESE